LGLLASVIGVYYYLNIIVQMYFRARENDFSDDGRHAGAKATAVIAAIASLVLGLFTIRYFTPTITPGEAAGAPRPTTPAAERAAPPSPGTPVSRR
jgi:formate hydrogenlyase subunit 3/multisubunit Na+/H+ antiporter MnhD subunit